MYYCKLFQQFSVNLIIKNNANNNNQLTAEKKVFSSTKIEVLLVKTNWKYLDQCVFVNAYKDLIQLYLKSRLHLVHERKQQCALTRKTSIINLLQKKKCLALTRFCRQRGVMAGKVTLLAWKFMLLPFMCNELWAELPSIQWQHFKVQIIVSR